MATIGGIGYFGGSFDPPHRGHLTVARAAQAAFQLERVLLAPTGRQPLKPEGATAAYADRLAMTALLCEGEKGLEASDLDAPCLDGSPNYTVDTLRRLHSFFPAESRIFAIIGEDAFRGLPRWRDTDALFDLAEWIVVSRPSQAAQKDPFHDGCSELLLNSEQRARVHTLDTVHDPASATALRHLLALHEPCGELLTPAVFRFILQNHLYGA